jgi:phosphatidylglycerophosphate synthase
MERRPIKSRDFRLLRRISHHVASFGITPNQISACSLVFALAGSVLLAGLPHSPMALVGAVVFIQLRLLCNLLDGLVAIEGRKANATGPFFNEAPDRIADTLLLVPVGYAMGQGWIGWLIACLALGTAYLRAFGAALGFGEDFRGPGAKPHRMALLAFTCLCAALEAFWQTPFWSFCGGSLALVLLVGLTVARRALRILDRLSTSGAGDPRRKAAGE